jgi:hypothetical protein
MASPATIFENDMFNAAWQMFCTNIGNGNDAELQANLPQTIITRIQDSYSNLTGGSVFPILDQDRNVIRFTKNSVAVSTASIPTVATPASVSSADTHGRKSKAKVPRPPNSFILYRQHYHPIIKEQIPGIANNDICKSLHITRKNCIH